MRPDRPPSDLPALTRAIPVSVLVPTLTAILSLLSLIWAGYLSIRAPNLGMESGGNDPVVVLWVDPDGPAAGKVAKGDAILTLDEAPLEAYTRQWGFRAAGDSLVFGVRDAQGVERSVQIVLTSPLSSRVLIDRLLPLAVSLVFWLSSLVVIAVSTREGENTRVARLYFGFCQSVVFFVTTLQMSLLVSEPAMRLTMVSGSWMGALAVAFHARFPFTWTAKPPVRVGLGLAYGIAAVISVLAFLLSSYADLWWLGNMVGNWYTACLIVVVVLLILALFQRTRVDVAVQARLTALTALAGFLPALLLTLIPMFDWNPLDPIMDVVAPSQTFVFMALVPIGYAYAILRYKLIRYDGTVSRAIGYVIAILLMVGVLITLIVLLFASRIIPAGPTFLVAVVALTVALAVAFEPVRHRIQDAVDQIFERPWAEFRTTLLNVDETLAGTPDVAVWATTVCRQFSSALDLTPVGLLYRSPQETVMHLVLHDPAGAAAALAGGLHAGSPLVAHLASLQRPARARDLRATLGAADPASPEAAWLASGAFDLWWPIRAHDRLKAVLLLGPRPSAFTDEEIELLALASHQIGAALENAEYARELEQLSRAALATRDDERRRVSHELHDHIIRPLVGLNFTLATVRDVPQAAEAREQISDLITHVRRISADLRPPALDEVGLGAAVHGLTRTFTRATGLSVDLAILPDEDIDVPEPIASTIYSALREALNNVQKYAQATRVSVLLEVSAGQLLLVAHDDGVGFTLPDRLGKLATGGHFGLLGLQERLTTINGSLEIQTSPGQGTRLECRAPLPSP